MLRILQRVMIGILYILLYRSSKLTCHQSQKIIQRLISHNYLTSDSIDTIIFTTVEINVTPIRKKKKKKSEFDIHLLCF